jgi:glycosyltransferase involved in cell wall biosynthesis
VVSYEDTFPEVRDLSVHQFLPPLPRVLHRRRLALAVLAGIAFLSHRIDRGVVLCSSSGWSHWIRGRAPRVVYCHTPARWLYEPDDYFRGLSSGARWALSTVLAPLRAVDRRRMRGAAVVVANGPVTAERVRRAYGIQAETVLPPPGLSAQGPSDPVRGVEEDFFLTVSRARGYKNLDLIASVFRERRKEQLVIVGADVEMPDSDRVLVAGTVPDAQLRWLYAHARAVICLAHEDLGLVPLEAFQFGTPAVALAAGGYLATCTPGVNAVMVEQESGASLNRALDEFREALLPREKVIESAAAFDGERFQREIAAAVHRATSASGG